MRRRRFFNVTLAAIVGATFARAASTPDGGVAETTVPPPLPDGGVALLADGGMPPEVEVVWDLQIPLPNREPLRGTLYRQKYSSGKSPVVLALTSRVADTYYPLALELARSGYVFAAIDLPGRGNSPGEFRPFDAEGREGREVVEWLAGQPWSNGSVGMCGSVHDGFVQWSTAGEGSSHLKSMAPASAMAPGIDFPSVKNVVRSEAIEWLVSTMGRYDHEWSLSERAWWGVKLGDFVKSGVPFSGFGSMLGPRARIFESWMEHPAFDSYWEAKLPASHYEKIKMPVLTVTSQYDPRQAGALHHYQAHLRNASAIAEKHFLVIGAWTPDALWRPPKEAELGGVKLGPASLMDIRKLHREWFDWTLRSGKKPDFLKQRVAYYVTGAEEWRYADRLDAIGSKKRLFYLSSHTHGASEVLSSGRLADAKPEGGSADAYVYDPKKTAGMELEQREIKNWLTDARAELDLRGDGLVYHTDVIKDQFDLAGFAKLSAWIQMDVPDTDFRVLLYEVLSNGTSVLLGEDLQRARYRESLKQERLAADRPERYEFNFNFIARRIAKGSRLRLVLRAPRSLFIQRNYNSGGVVAQETPAQARVAHVKLLHDPQHPSVLEIPFGG